MTAALVITLVLVAGAIGFKFGSDVAHRRYYGPTKAQRWEDVKSRVFTAALIRATQKHRAPAKSFNAFTAPL